MNGEAPPALLNIFAEIPAELPEEDVTVLLERPGLRLERIVSRGHTSPEDYWYDQEEDEWVMLIQGRARLRIEGETTDRELSPGDHLMLPARCRHRVTWTDPDEDTVWLALFVAL